MTRSVLPYSIALLFKAFQALMYSSGTAMDESDDKASERGFQNYGDIMSLSN